MNWSEFFHMGGYAFFVWTSYAITFAVIIANVAALFGIMVFLKKENYFKAWFSSALTCGVDLGIFGFR